MLENKAGLKVGVVVNDVAAVNVDAKLVQRDGRVGAGAAWALWTPVRARRPRWRARVAHERARAAKPKAGGPDYPTARIGSNGGVKVTGGADRGANTQGAGSQWVSQGGTVRCVGSSPATCNRRWTR